MEAGFAAVTFAFMTAVFAFFPAFALTVGLCYMFDLDFSIPLLIAVEFSIGGLFWIWLKAQDKKGRRGG